MNTLLCALIGLGTSSAIAFIGAKILERGRLVPVRVKAQRQRRR